MTETDSNSAGARQQIAKHRPQVEGRDVPHTGHNPRSLERARTQWQFGDWRSLSEIPWAVLENHPDRGELALLVAAAYLQTGKLSEGKELIGRAIEWGCSRQSTLRTLVSGAHNSLGRACLLTGAHAQGSEHFERAVSIGMPDGDARLLARARANEQAFQLDTDPRGPTSFRTLTDTLSGWSPGIPHVASLGATEGFSPPIPTGKCRWVICCHHKSGTNFLVKTFRSIAEKQSKVLWMKFYEPMNPPDHWDICIHQHARVHDLLSATDIRGLRCVRHPMSLIYSAMLYHQKCSEPWVDVPLEGFSSSTFWSATDGILYNRIKDPDISADVKHEIMNRSYNDRMPSEIERFDSAYEMKGKTYRQYLSELSTTEEKLLFEMRAYSRGVISGMLSFPWDNRFMMVRLEDMSWDRRMMSLYSGFLHLGIDGTDLTQALESASENSLWHVGRDGAGSHATTGISDGWRSFFQGKVLEEFRRLFGNAEEMLGYPLHDGG